MAAGEGFEPSQTESESGVLPLHNPAKCRCYYSLFFQKVKCFLKFVFIAGGTVFYRSSCKSDSTYAFCSFARLQRAVNAVAS